MMEHRGYIGKVEFDDEAAIFHGEIINTRDVITFQGRSVSELTQAFRESIDDYLAFCEQHGESPDKPFSGQFATRVPPELHRQLHIAAAIAGKSLNAFVTEQLRIAVQKAGAANPPGKSAAKATKVKSKNASPKREKGAGPRADWHGWNGLSRATSGRPIERTIRNHRS